MQFCTLTLFALALSALLSDSALADTSPAQPVLQHPIGQAVNSRISRPDLRGVQHCAIVPRGHHSADSVPHVRTSLRVDPDRGWGVVFTELLDPSNPKGEPLAGLGMVNHEGALKRLEKQKSDIVQEWTWLLPGRTAEEVNAMVSCAGAQIRKGWRAPLPRRPELCAHQPLARDGTLIYLQTTVQFDAKTFRDRIVVDAYPSLAHAQAAARVLADTPEDWFETNFELHSDQTLFAEWPSSPKKWAAYSKRYISSHLETHSNWRTADELRVLVDCARHRAEREAQKDARGREVA